MSMLGGKKSPEISRVSDGKKQTVIYVSRVHSQHDGIFRHPAITNKIISIIIAEQNNLNTNIEGNF